MINQISPNPSLLKRGIIPPFGKGRLGGISQNNIVIPTKKVTALEPLNPKILEPFEVTKT
jgi:hypothetical protein